MKKVTLVVRTHFDAAHNLWDYKGACARLHGHRWWIDIEITGRINPKTGMLMDFKDIKRIVDPLLPDHQYLNDVWPDINPTAENISVKLGSVLKKKLPGFRRVTVWETENTGVTFP